MLCTSYLEFTLVPHAVVILRFQVGHRLRGDVRNICQSSKRNEINCSSNVSCVRGTGSTFRDNEILTMKSTRHRAVHYVIWTVLLGVGGRRRGGELSEAFFLGAGSKGNLFLWGDVGSKVDKDELK